MLPNPYEVYIGLEAGAPAFIRDFEPIVVNDTLTVRALRSKAGESDG